MPEKTVEFRWYEGLAICLAMIGVQLCSEVIAVWGTVFYSPPVNTGRIVYVAIGLVGIIFIVGRVFDALTDPLIGAWSDRTRPCPRWRVPRIAGRRRPFIFWGAVLMLFSNIALWYPPVAGESLANLLYGTGIVCLHWLFFTICVVPLNSLVPEISRSQRTRIRLGQWVAVGMILGLAIANIAPPALIVRLDPARQQEAATALEAPAGAPLPAPDAVPHTEPDPAQAEPELFSPLGYQRTAAVFAVLSTLLLLLPVLVVRERYVEDAATTRSSPAVTEMLDTLRNGVFLRFVLAFFLFMIGYLAAQRVLPYWAIVGLGGSEDTVALLMAPFIFFALASAFLLMPFLSRLLPIKWLWFLSFVIIATGLPLMYPIATSNIAHPLLPAAWFDAWLGITGAATVATGNKMLLGALMFAYCGVGQGIQYAVTPPLIAECIDLDETRSGRRREAVYNGFSGIAFKAGQALSIAVATTCMWLWGNSAENPTGIYLVGPVAGLFGILGIVVVWFYPVLHVVPQTTAEFLAQQDERPAGRAE